MRIPTICRYCGGKVVLTSASEIYEKSAERIYLCRNCNAYVGVHAGSNRPLGRLANAVLRMKRRETHEIFDAFWRSRGLSRTQAYRWLAAALHLPESGAHIGNFEMDDCQRVITLCRENENKEAA